MKYKHIINTVYRMDNGLIVVFDKDGKQMRSFQGLDTPELNKKIHRRVKRQKYSPAWFIHKNLIKRELSLKEVKNPTDSLEMIICKACKGIGEIKEYYEHFDHEDPYAHDISVSNETCEYCEGTGKVIKEV